MAGNKMQLLWLFYFIQTQKIGSILHGSGGSSLLVYGIKL